MENRRIPPTISETPSTPCMMGRSAATPYRNRTSSTFASGTETLVRAASISSMAASVTRIPSYVGVAPKSSPHRPVGKVDSGMAELSPIGAVHVNRLRARPPPFDTIHLVHQRMLSAT